MNRQQQSSTNSLEGLLDSDRDVDYLDNSTEGGELDSGLRDADLDSCFSDGDVFDPPAPWRPGRFLQFADIDLTAEDEPSVRPVSLPTERLGHAAGHCTRAGVEGRERFESLSLSESTSGSGSFVVQMDSDRMLCLRHWKPSMSRSTLVLMTSCMTVALTALTLLSFVL